MTMLRWTLLTAMSLLFCITAIVAQPPKDSAYIYLPDVQAKKGNILILPVKISTYDVVLGVQFSMNWDSTMFQFVGVTDFGLPKMNATDNFGATNVTGGKLGFLWYDQSSVGIASTQGKILFNLKVKVIGDNALSSIKITSTPTEIEILNLGNTAMKHRLKNGNIAIGTVADNNTTSVEQNLSAPFPNPLTYGTSKIRMDLTENSTIELNIFDALGKNIFHINNFYNIGTHFVELQRNQFAQSGVYLYQLKTDKGDTLTGKLIVQ